MRSRRPAAISAAEKAWVYVPLTRRQKRLLEEAAALRKIPMGDLAREMMLAGGLRRLEKGPLAAE